MDFSQSNHQPDSETQLPEVANQAAAEMEALLRGLEITPDTQRTVRADSSASPESRFSYAWFFLVFWLTLFATLILSWGMIL